MKDKTNPKLENILRQKAEELLEKKSINTDKHYTDIEIFKLVHELDVHQIELEMQNEELNSAKIKAETEAEKYTNLYDFAPSGYFTLSKEAEIIELNFSGATLLGKERSLLVNKRFALFIADESKPTFNLFLEEIFKSKTKQTCEVLLCTISEIPTFVNLTGIIDEDDKQCVITMHDVSQRKKAEENLIKSKLLLQSTLESQLGTIIFSIDKEYNYLSFNKAHSDIMKQTYNSDVKVGMNILEYMSVIEDRKIAKENFDRALNGESHSNIRIFGDIEKAYFESFFNPILDVNNKIIGATGLARNITKRIQNQENLKISEEKYRTLFETNRDSITIFRLDKEDKPGYFIEANPATTTLLGYTKEELLAMTIGDVEILSEKKRKSRIATLIAKGRIDFETIIKNKKGKHRIVEIETLIVNYINEPAIMNITRDITERKQTEENARKAQDNLVTILQAIPDLLFEVDLQGSIYFYQGYHNELLSIPAKEFMGKTLQEVFPVDAANVCLEAMQEALNKGWSTGKQYSLNNLPQGKCWFEISVSPIQGTESKDTHFIMISRDVTERKKAEEKLRVEKERIRTILELVGNPIFLKDNEHKVTYANSSFYTLFGLNEKNVIGKTLVENVPENEQEHFLKIDRTVLDTGITDIREETLTVNGKIHTIITSKTRFIDASGNKSLVGSIYDITDRKKAEEALQKSQEKLRGVFDLANSGIILTDLKGKYLLFNNWLTKALGYTRGELNKLTRKDLTHPDDLETSDITFNKLIEGKIDRYQLEKRFIRKDKSYFWVEISVSAIKDKNNKVVNTIGIINDITEKRNAKVALQESEARLIEAQSVAKVGSWETDLSFTDIIWSKENYAIFGLDPNTGAPTLEKFLAIVHPKDRPIVESTFVHSIKSQTLNTFEHRIITADGIEKTLEERWKITRDEQGQPYKAVGTCQDITERKEAEQKLIDNERFLHQTQTIANLGSYSLDFKTEKWTSTSILDQIFGINANFERTNEGWQKILHPDWRDIMNDYFINEVIAKKINFNKDYKIIKIDSKEERWVHGMGEIIYNNEGHPIQLIGSIQDITEQKLAEETLRESEEKYRSLVENSPDGVVIYIEDKIAFINGEGIRMLGAKSKEEIIGKPVLQFVHQDSIEDVSKRMKEVVTDNYISKSIEEKFMRVDGTPFDVEIKGTPTLYEHKNAVQVIIHDITLRKQSSLELSKINRVYALISQINNLIIRTRNKEELFQEICNIAVDFGKFRMSWIGLLNENDKIITGAFAGHEDGYFTKSNITTNLDKPEGRGPTGIAMREARTVICNDIANDPIMKPWRKDALERGYSSSISIPIIVRNKIIGTFNLYAEERNFFSSEEEISLLEKIILNISFALEKIQIEEDRKQTEEKIRQLSQAVEQSPVTIVITNTNGEIEYANPKFVESTGYAIEDVLGKNPRVLKSGYTSHNEYKDLWQTISAGNEWHGEFHNKKKDGTLFWESATISPILNTDGKTTHFIAIKEDITHRKNVEKQLVKSKERAEESDRLKLAFLANMSHEIRTPMNGILGFTELLKEPKLTGEEQQEYINIIEKSGKRMLNIINDIISISKVESGQIEVSLSETNINEQIEYIQTFFKPEAKQKGIELFVSKKLATQDTFIKTDREKVYAVLTNLVKNAIKFTNEGSIEFGCEKKGKHLEFFIKDTGLGISKSQKKIIFERFRQANETISRSHEGSGLGLAISKAYVEMLGGKIWVESKEREGSTFYFTIPFDSENKTEEKNSIEKASSEIKAKNTIKDLKVLIVEDDAISKLLITIAVKPYSKEIIKVSTGIEAIDACRNNPDIDLVMMDINMPKMGGYEATKLIREFNKNLVIIAQTANGMQSDRDNAIAAGCTDYISKPINITSLGDLIQKYFSK